jgi:hypothetical protein
METGKGDASTLVRRLRAAGWHLAISAVICSLAALLVLAFWYPNDYRHIAGGQTILLLLAGVDVVMGPLLTLVVFNTKTKSRSHLARDLLVIALLQIAAFGYGVFTAYSARPVALVFEVDRFKVVRATEVLTSELANVAPPYQQLSITGPVLLSTREPADADERNKALMLSLSGFDIGQRPSFWQPYGTATPRVLSKSRPVTDLIIRYPREADMIWRRLESLSLSANEARFLPIHGHGAWVVLMRANGEPVGFAPLEGFF